MSLLPFVVVTVAGGGLSVFVRREARLSAAIAAVALLAALVAASTIRPESPVVLGGVGLAGSDYTRLFLVLGTLGGGLVAVLAAATGWSRTLPGAWLLTLGATAVSLGTTDGATAIAAATAGAASATLAIASGVAGERGIGVAVRELRALTVAGMLALIATAVVAGPLAAAGGLAAGPGGNVPLVGLAFLAVAVATAIRLGLIPFHLRAARTADAVPEVALPLVMAWSPTAFALVALGWTGGAIASPTLSLPVEQALVVLAAGATVVFATGGALLHDDLEHVVAYSIVADAGVALLAFASLDPAAAGPARTWLLAFVVGKSALAGWAAAVHSTLGRNRLSELSGWARRVPGLAVALAAIGVAGLGWPGAAVFTARGDLVAGAVGGPLAVALLAAAIASVVVPVRLLAVGVRADRGRAPVPGRRPPVPRAPVRPLAAGRAGGVRATAGHWAGEAIARWSAHREPIAVGCVLALAGLALAASAGAFGVEGAAAAAPLPTGPAAPSGAG